MLCLVLSVENNKLASDFFCFFLAALTALNRVLVKNYKF